MSNVTINQLPTASTIDAVQDIIPIYTASSSATQGISRNTLLGLSSSPVGISDSQTLSNKTLTSPTINGATLSGTLSGTYTIGGTPTFPSSVTQNSATQTLTNKTLTSPTINSPTISNATISADAITGYTVSNTGTIYGISISGGALGSNTVTSSSITAGAVQPQALLSGTGTSWIWQSWTPTLSNITQGNGTLDTKYIQIGKTVFFSFDFILGSTSSIGTGPSFTLPSTPRSFSDTASGIRPIGYAHFEHNAVNSNEGRVTITASPTSSCFFEVLNASGTYASYTQPTSTVPFTFSSGDAVFAQGYYESS